MRRMGEEPMKSNARRTLIATLFVGWSAAAALAFSDHAVLNLLLLIIFGFCSVFLMLIRCENCGTLLYRKDKKEHGFPSFAMLFPDTTCPVCGIERR